MLYVFYGAPKQVTEKVEATLASLRAKSTDAHVVRVEESMVADGSNALAELLGEQGLFKSNYIVYINTRSSEVLAKWVIDDTHLTLLQTSHHLCIVALEDLGGTSPTVAHERVKKTLETYAEKIQECKEVRGKHEDIRNTRSATLPPRSPFAITDALLTKDTKALFVELEHARLSGAVAEEVVGTLFWAAKTMALAASAKTAAEAGLKDFPFRKAQQGMQVWGAPGAGQLLYTLATAPSRAYEKNEDLYSLLERELCG